MDEHLIAWFRDEVVTPIVASLLTPDELASIEVWVAPRPPLSPGLLRLEALHGVEPPGEEWAEPQVWVDVTARDGHGYYRNTVVAEHELLDIEAVREAAARWASDLEDWVCETSFGWGQQRTAQLPVIRRA